MALRAAQPTSGVFITAEALVGAFRDAFAPQRVDVEFFEDLSGIDFVRVWEPNSPFFQLFSHETNPTNVDLLNWIVGGEGDEAVVGIEAYETLVVGAREREAKTCEIALKYRLPIDSYPAMWTDPKHQYGERGNQAMQELEEFWSANRPLRLRYANDPQAEP